MSKQYQKQKEKWYHNGFVDGYNQAVKDSVRLLKLIKKRKKKGENAK